MSTNTDAQDMNDSLNDFSRSIRRDIYNSRLEEESPKKYFCRTRPAHVPPDVSAHHVPREGTVHSQDILEFMYQKQEESNERYHREREEAKQRLANRKLKEYIPRDSAYTPPIQKYDQNRPYLQEYVRYKNELRPVVMPVFGVVKGSFRDKAKSQYMPKKDPNHVSKKSQLFEQRKQRIMDEEKEAERIRNIMRTKKMEETNFISRREQSDQQLKALASPISPRSNQSTQRPSTTASFRDSSHKVTRPVTAIDRRAPTTAGNIWLTNL